MTGSGRTLVYAALLCGVVGLTGCGGDGSSSPTSSTPAPPDYSGTWAASLGNEQGSFVFVVSGSTVTSLTYGFSHSASSGGGSCTVSVGCPAGVPCASPTTSSISGSTITFVRDSAYSGSGTFSSQNACSGSITYTITSSASLCNTTQTTTWTPSRS